MKTIVTALLILVAAVSAQASDQTRFEALIRKTIPRYVDQFTTFAPKTACLCDPVGAKAPGVLLQDDDYIRCMRPVFQANGSLLAFETCPKEFLVLER